METPTRKKWQREKSEQIKQIRLILQDFLSFYFFLFLLLQMLLGQNDFDFPRIHESPMREPQILLQTAESRF